MKRLFLAIGLALFLTPLFLAAAETTLPPPTTKGGKPLFDALASRASAPGGANFPSRALDPQDLSTLLWAGSGLNRPGRWTVPFAMGVEPYVRIYVFGPEEVALYNWSRHSLLQVEEGDWRSRVNPQGFARAASHILVFVSDKTPLQGKGGIPEVWDKWLGVATGAMTQDIYLAADALGIGARYAETMDQPFLREILTIPSGEAPLAILALGKR